MSIKSATAWFKAAHNKLVSKTVTGVWTIEQLDEWKAHVKGAIEKQGGVIEKFDDEKGMCTIVDSAQYFFYPKMKGYSEGVLTVRSKDYIHNDVFGDKKGSTIVDGNLVKMIDSMVITFRIMTCSKCGGDTADVDQICAFDEDVKGKEVKCDCCASCYKECAYNI